MLLERVPDDALGVVLVPQVRQLSGQLGTLYARLQPRFPDLDKLAGDLKLQLGFDLLDPASLEEIGLDPDGALLAAAHRDWLLFGVTVDRPSRFRKQLRSRLERTSGGELTVRTSRIGDREVLLLVPAQPPDAPPRLACVEDGPNLLLVPDRSLLDQPVDPLATLTRLLELPAVKALPAQPQFQAQWSSRLPDTGLWLWFSGAPVTVGMATQLRHQGRQDMARLLQGLSRALEGLALGLTVSGERIRLTGQARVEPRQYALMQQHLQPTGSTMDFGKQVQSDAILFVQGGFNPPLVYQLARQYLPAADRDGLDQALALLKTQGVDLEAELLASFTGNLALALYRIDVMAAIKQLGSKQPSFDPALLDLALYLQLTDAGRARGLLERLASMLQLAGITIETGEADGVATTRLAQGPRVLGGWALREQLLVLTLGETRLTAAAQQLRQAKPTGLTATLTDETARQAVAGGPGQAGLLFSVRNLMRNLPLLALAAPQVGNTLSALDGLYLTLRVVPGGLAGELTLTLTPGVQP